MKFVLSLLSVVLVASIAVTLLLMRRVSTMQEGQSLMQLEWASEIVKKSLNSESARISAQLREFARSVAADQDFSLKLLVELDRSANEVLEVAPRFIGPMGLSILEICEGQSTVLSSGHMPASAGTPIGPKIHAMQQTPAFLDETINGQQQLTLQGRANFTIAENSFAVVGGVTIDTEFLKALCPHPEAIVLLKRGESIVGTVQVNSISEVKNRTILMNNTSYFVETLSLPFVGEGESPLLMILIEKPSPLSIRSLL